MHDSVVHKPAWMGDLAGRLKRSGRAARKQLAHYLSDIAEYWNRQPLDRFWPPHP